MRIRVFLLVIAALSIVGYFAKMAYDNRPGGAYQQISSRDGAVVTLDRRTHTLTLQRGSYQTVSHEPYYERLDGVECKLQGEMIDLPCIALRGWGRGQSFYGEYALYSRDHEGNLHPIRP